VEQEQSRSLKYVTPLISAEKKPAVRALLVGYKDKRIRRRQNRHFTESTAAVVYRIRILESNPAGFLDCFGFGMDIVSLSSGSGLSK